MRFKDNLITVICCILALAVLIGASLMINPINEQRREMNLVSNDPVENAPPSLAFATVAMGAFRGLVVDILWIRADKLKEEGLFFDAKQLADWITMLQPRFATVWDFQAWNMAYNISVTFPNTQCDERWRWVRNGYELLRDRGIPLNPHSILLYRSMAWIFQHKIGGITDDCHKYYRRELALTMRWILGSEPSRGFFQALAAAPEDMETLLRDPAVDAFVKKVVELEPKIEDPKALLEQWLNLYYFPDEFGEDTKYYLEQVYQELPFRAFDIFARAWQLRNTWKFDIDYMIGINDRYGPYSFDDPNEQVPMNWEHPQSHAIYWAALGLDRAGGEGDFTANEKNTDRIVAHGLQDMYHAGRIVMYPNQQGAPSLFLLPDLRYFKVLDREWKARIAKYEVEGERGATGMEDGHRNMLRASVVMFYMEGRLKEAREIYRELRMLYPREEFNVPMLKFVLDSVKEELSVVGVKSATEYIISSLKQSYFYYAIYEDEQSFARENFARQVYDIYLKEFSDPEVDRLELPDFSVLRYRALVQFLDDGYYSEDMRRNLLGRIRAERPDLYEKLEAMLKQEQESRTAPGQAPGQRPSTMQ